MAFPRTYLHFFLDNRGACRSCVLVKSLECQLTNASATLGLSRSERCLPLLASSTSYLLGPVYLIFSGSMNLLLLLRCRPLRLTGRAPCSCWLLLHYQLLLPCSCAPALLQEATNGLMLLLQVLLLLRRLCKVANIELCRCLLQPLLLPLLLPLRV